MGVRLFLTIWSGCTLWILFSFVQSRVIFKNITGTIFWADLNSIINYYYFGDSVTFDTTYIEWIVTESPLLHLQGGTIMSSNASSCWHYFLSFSCGFFWGRFAFIGLWKKNGNDTMSSRMNLSCLLSLSWVFEYLLLPVWNVEHSMVECMHQILESNTSISKN